MRGAVGSSASKNQILENIAPSATVHGLPVRARVFHGKHSEFPATCRIITTACVSAGQRREHGRLIAGTGTIFDRNRDFNGRNRELRGHNGIDAIRLYHASSEEVGIA